MRTNNNYKKIELTLAVMTKVQRRRWRLRLGGYSLRQIAKAEGVGVQRVWKSLCAGRKRAKKLLNL